MGVTGLWDLIEGCIERVPSSHIKGKKIAVDLAWWVMADRSIAASRIQGQKLGEFKNFGPKDVQNFHLRNLFFRIQKMISLGAEPVFVLDGKAPERKLQTIAARLGQKNVVSGERRQLVRLFKPCCDLFDSLGIMWIQAPFEAEKMCATLQLARKVDAVLTQDGDAFCFGASEIYRSFSSENDAELEFVRLSEISEKVGFDRWDFIVLALLLGCDFFPNGIKGVGPKLTINLIKTWKEKRMSPIQRLIMVKNRPEKASFKEEKKLAKLLGNYPEVNFQSLMLEFRSTTESENIEKVEIKSKKITAEKISEIFVKYLEWEKDKADKKALDFFIQTRRPSNDLKLLEITKKMKGGKSYEVTWSIGSRKLENIKMKTEELGEIAPDLLKEFDKSSSENNSKPKSKVPKPVSKPEKTSSKKSTDIRKFIQLKEINKIDESSKRKIFSPNRKSNPMPSKISKQKTPQKINSSGCGIEPANFSFGVSFLCDQLENSTIEDVENFEPENFEKTKTQEEISETQKIQKLQETEHSKKSQHSPIISSIMRPRKVSFSSSSDSDEEFLSLSERVRLRKLTANS